MVTVCKIDMCTGCSACAEICPKDAISIVDSISSLNAVIDQSKCIGCGACERICQQNHSPIKRETIASYQGWAHDETIRMKGSSGGVATALEKYFCTHMGYVCSCRFQNGRFEYYLTNQVDRLNFQGSKYVKSNPYGVYSPIKKLLKSGEKVLFVGLPCHVGAIKNYVGESLQDNLYTVDLVCHGTPSQKLLGKFLDERSICLPEVKAFQFREKDKFQIRHDLQYIGVQGTSDAYSIAFLSALTYTENCYHCIYAEKKRVSDITLGDSWGTSLSEEEQKKGISLMLVQSEKGDDLIKNSGIVLKQVDYENAVQNNGQLVQPSIKPKAWKAFFDGIEKGKSIQKLVIKILPKRCIKQLVKGMLIKLRLYHFK